MAAAGDQGAPQPPRWEADAVASALGLLHALGRLKTLPRQGWVDRGIPSPESVADHSYRTAVMAWILGDLAGLDTGLLVKLALAHDLPEAEAGDATPYDQAVGRGVEIADAVARWRELLTMEQLSRQRTAKHEREARALNQLAALFPSAATDEVSRLWQDYAAGTTPEARFLAQIDKLEALLQAAEYRAAGHQADVENFLASARELVEHPVLAGILQAIEREISADL